MSQNLKMTLTLHPWTIDIIFTFNWCANHSYISSSSSCRAASTDIPDHLSPLLPIIHRLRQGFWVTSCVLT